MTNWQNISLWMDQIGVIEPRPALQHDASFDVVIIGGGYTGLWSAYYLKRLAPHLSICILEAEVVGYGASGRNGGWLMGDIAGASRLSARLPKSRQQAVQQLLHAIPNEVQAVIQQHGIDCDFVKGGVLYCAARYREQLPRLQAYFADLMQAGYGAGDFCWLSADELSTRLAMHDAFAAVYSPHCARIQPAKLARGLAAVLATMGVEIHEQSPVTRWQQGQVQTADASIQCEWIIPAMEAYGASATNPYGQLGRYQLPVQSMIIATEPLPESVWQAIGLQQGEVFSDFCRQITYGQRSADNRMVFGTRGTYQFKGRLRRRFELSENEFSMRRRIMHQLFPPLQSYQVTHGWGGNLSLSRAFHPHMLVDQKNGFALAGAYGGEGVGAANLAGRTLANLILQRDDPCLQAPWVYPRGGLSQLKKWEAEPLPWLGYKAIGMSYDWEENTLANAGSPQWKRKLSSVLADFMQERIEPG